MKNSDSRLDAYIRGSLKVVLVVERLKESCVCLYDAIMVREEKHVCNNVVRKVMSMIVDRRKGRGVNLKEEC